MVSIIPLAIPFIYEDLITSDISTPYSLSNSTRQFQNIPGLTVGSAIHGVPIKNNIKVVNVNITNIFFNL
jgi:hypothetical protein